MATVEERIKSLEEKEKQLKAQRKILLSRQKDKERKARTKRLIEKGAIVEKLLDCEDATPEETEKMLQNLIAKKNTPEIAKTEKIKEDKTPTKGTK